MTQVLIQLNWALLLISAPCGPWLNLACGHILGNGQSKKNFKKFNLSDLPFNLIPHTAQPTKVLLMTTLDCKIFKWVLKITTVDMGSSKFNPFLGFGIESTCYSSKYWLNLVWIQLVMSSVTNLSLVG